MSACKTPQGFLRSVLGAAAGIVMLAGASTGATAAEPVEIGLVAALSGQSAKSGEAITRGLTMAIEEINQNGGVLGGRKIELIRRDDESNPAKGQIAARELIFREDVAVFFGGLDSPVSLAIVPVANEAGTPFMGVWAAATGITRNGADPNYVFRVSAVDAIVDRALLEYGKEKYGTTKAGLILINNPWGESNEEGMHEAVEHVDGVEIVGVEKFENKDVDVVPQLTRLKQAGTDTLFLVANAAPGAQMMKSLGRMGWDVPVVSHWGISGGRFPELAGNMAEKVDFVQTYSFFGEQNEIGERLLSRLKERYDDIDGPEDVIPPVAIANSYDAMHLVARAIDKAGSTDGEAIRQALLDIESYDGLIKRYAPPFTRDNHDALSYEDYVMVRYDGTQIKPVD